MNGFSLRDYQMKAVDDVRHAYRTGARAPLLVMPTGAGKTQVFSYITREAASRGFDVLILAHRLELIRQASRKLTQADVEHGIIAPRFAQSAAPIQVGSVATLARRLTNRRFRLIVVDEAHHATAAQYVRILKTQPDAKILGVTATPERLDGRGLGRQAGGIFDQIVLGPSVSELIGGGYLTPFTIYAPPSNLNLSQIKRSHGDYDPVELAEQISESSITGDAVEHYGRLTPGKPAIAFCTSVGEAEKSAESFRAAGWRAACAHGRMLESARNAAIGGLASGSVQILTCCDLISEGLDIPAVCVVILLRPTQSLGLFLQQVGRGLRPETGKDRLIILDHAGNCLVHGTPATPHDWTLEGKKKRKDNEVKIWRCPDCYAVQAPARKCVACSYEVPRGSGGPGRQVAQQEGELEELDAERLAFLRRGSYGDVIRQAKTLDDLHEIARVRGYKAGWVFHTMRERGLENDRGN